MTSLPVRGRILDEAAKATLKSRNQSYGDPYPNLRLAADMLALYQAAAGKKYNPAHDAAIAMVLAKVARIATGAVGHEDNYVDGAAYMAIAAECQTVGSVVWQNREAVLTPNEIATLLKGFPVNPQHGDIVVTDPINVNTKLPEEPVRHVEAHEPKPREPIMPMIDPDSPGMAFSDDRVSFKLGSLVKFGPGGEDYHEPLWTIIRIDPGDFGEFVAQHESSGGKYRGIAKHIYKVITY